MSISELFASINHIQGVGPKAEEALNRLGCSRVIDLIYHLPISILERKLIVNLAHATAGTYITTKITIESIDQSAPRYRKASKRKFEILCSNGNYYITLVFFNYYPEYLLKTLKIGDQRIISGRVEKFGSKLIMAHPDYVLPLGQESTIPKIEPIYPLTYGLNSRQLYKIIKQALNLLPQFSEWLDNEQLYKYRWHSFYDSVIMCHNPVSNQDLMSDNPYRSRLAYDELLANQLSLALIRHNRNKILGQSIDVPGHFLKVVLDKIHFKLTAGQINALHEITNDQRASIRMMRLIQGDVGSGKTIVALGAMLNTAEYNKQAVLMAPTDLLANQHYEWITAVTNDLNIKIHLLTGKIKSKARAKILNDILSGTSQLVIGTHALFQENVIFNDLGLVVIDEQHRFGVQQRLALINKNAKADILVMSATPIPRTLTMALYGDMDISYLTEKPAGRMPIVTSLVPMIQLPKLCSSLHKSLEQGHKIYWICPLIDSEVDETQLTNNDLTAATTRYNILGELFPGKVGLIHGKMSDLSKNQIMTEFATSQINILVATTVIEVGIDVPDANIIIIEQAERFGLSQLHQLRGRVGRGHTQSYCILLYGFPISETAKARLKIMKESNDGFVIAEKDLALRGAGDLLGTKQSGLPDFKFADLVTHHGLFSEARQEATNILQADPHLSNDTGKKLRNLLKFFGYDNIFQRLHQ